MVKSKQAFTLAEIMVVMAIIGVVTVCMLIMYRPNNHKVLRNEYYKAYKTLAIAAYNVYAKEESEELPKLESELKGHGGDPYRPQDESMQTGYAKDNIVLYAEERRLCSEIADFMNGSASCSGGHPLTSPNVNSPDIITSNEMRFYFSEPFIEGKNIHRIVWVDLNGAREGKNTATWTEREPADIVAFDIGDFGEVVPLGYPKIDARYTQGVVITDRDGNNYIDAPTTFYEAQLAAFGGQYNEFDVMSTNLEVLKKTLY